MLEPADPGAKSVLVTELRDARTWQIAALGTLLCWNIATIDLGASLVPSLVAIISALLTQAVATALGAAKKLDLRSPLITGCSLALLVRGDALWVPALAAVLGIGAKFVFRIRGKHIWNPAAFGIFVLLQTGHAWVSPGQWGSGPFIVTLIVFAGILVLSKATRLDTALAFLGTHLGLLLLRAQWLGDPLVIPLHQVQNGALLLYAFFMITDPRTTPDNRWARIFFAVAVAATAHWLLFFQQLRPALYVALVGLAPLVPLLDRLFPAKAFAWRPNQENAAMPRPMPRLVRPALVALLAAGGLALSFVPAAAFCGFYVAQADAKLFNKSSQVVLARDGEQTSITMASDYEGDPKEFALVVPVPTVVAQDDIRVVDNHLIEKLDAYSAPRLTEYFDPDPCPEERDLVTEAMPVLAPLMAPAQTAPAGPDAHGVTIEAKYQVGVYDILILSAKESDGLVAWLTENHYRIPAGADDVLGSYIRQGMHFFVAKVNLARQEQAGEHYLRPLQVSYASKKFMLPIRLGTVNANGPQDMIVFVLSRKGRVETTNYQTVKMASGLDVPLFVKDEFGPVYKAAYDKTVADDGMTRIYEEYAWDMRGYMPCDPCSAEVPDSTDLFALGASWHYPEYAHASVEQMKHVRLTPKENDAYITRLHVRYNAAHFPEDLAFAETSDRASFQVVYKLQHPWLEPSRCRAGDAYLRTLPPRFRQEAENLVHLTGWNEQEVRDKMQAHGQPFDVKPPGLFDRIFR